MHYTAQIENPKLLQEALDSDCQTIRFGAEFCEIKLPSSNQIRYCYEKVRSANKQFAYICPRLPDNSLALELEHLGVLNDLAQDAIQVIVNDWGVLNLLIEGRYPNLIPYLGRQLVSIPRRGRPSIVDLMSSENSLKHFVMNKVTGVVFDKTDMNFKPTLRFLTAKKVRGVNIDWVPDCFPHMRSIVKEGLAVSVYLHLIIVAITRRCHMAKHFGENIPDECSRPCYQKAFLLKHNAIGDFRMDGNTLFDMLDPTRASISRLQSSGASELVLTISPVTGIETTNEINQIIQQIENWI